MCSLLCWDLIGVVAEGSVGQVPVGVVSWRVFDVYWGVTVGSVWLVFSQDGLLAGCYSSRK
ncbi:Uncharacterised protein [Dermatophilus congolensis]|uniref:Uncharacterized protein n=1 Tax=Dermatophilus congolensis TaxID=1863 RepID=A0A239V9Z9_9MICO|nr:Uncharacterised protein [Dermatophilus congolensis]